MWKKLLSALGALGVGAAIVLGRMDLHATEALPVARPPISVRAEKPEVRDIEVRLAYPAELQPFAKSRIRSIGARGVVRRIYVDKGDKVQRGQKLVTIDCPDYRSRQRQAEKEVRNMSAHHKNAARVVERLRPVRAQELISQQELDVAEANHDIAFGRLQAAGKMVEEAQASLSFCHIRAPFSGEVGMRWMDPGAQLRPGAEEILRLIDISKIRVWLNVVGEDARHLKEGLVVELRVAGLPSRLFKGTVTRFARRLDPRTRTALTEVILPNADRALRPGMYGRAAIVAEKRARAVLVPERAVLTQQCGEYGEKQCHWVYVISADTAKRVSVELGHELEGRVQVTSGLRGDELVVTAGKELLGDGSAVKVVQ